MLKIAKLVTREFVIGRLVQNVLLNVFLINFKANPVTGQIDINLVPYLSPISKSLAPIISSDKIVAFEDATTDLIQLYIRAATQFSAEQPSPEKDEPAADQTQENTTLLENANEPDCNCQTAE